MSISLYIEPLSYQTAMENAGVILSLGADNIGEYWTSENLLAEKSEKWNLSLIAKIGNEICGYLIASNKEGKIHIHHLIVGKEFRNNNIGTQLIKYLEYINATKYSAITLKVYYENHKAIKFYNANGYSTILESGDYFMMEKLMK